MDELQFRKIRVEIEIGSLKLLLEQEFPGSVASKEIKY